MLNDEFTNVQFLLQQFKMRQFSRAFGNMDATSQAYTEGNPNAHQAPISWEGFPKAYLEREGGYLYEWVRGRVERTEQSINHCQFHICENLQKHFIQLLFAGKLTGFLQPEADRFFLKDVHRRPDLAWFSDPQRVNMTKGQNEVPSFVIEIISNHDKADKLL